MSEMSAMPVDVWWLRKVHDRTRPRTLGYQRDRFHLWHPTTWIFSSETDINKITYTAYACRAPHWLGLGSLRLDMMSDTIGISSRDSRGNTRDGRSRMQRGSLSWRSMGSRSQPTTWVTWHRRQYCFGSTLGCRSGDRVHNPTVNTSYILFNSLDACGSGTREARDLSRGERMNRYHKIYKVRNPTRSTMLTCPLPICLRDHFQTCWQYFGRTLGIQSYHHQQSSPNPSRRYVSLLKWVWVSGGMRK